MKKRTVLKNKCIDRRSVSDEVGVCAPACVSWVYSKAQKCIKRSCAEAGYVLMETNPGATNAMSNISIIFADRETG